MLMRSLVFQSALLCGLAVCTSCPALEGETDGAYVQSVNHRRTGSEMEFVVTIKLRRSGEYCVAAGYVKSNRMHQGSFTRTKFYTVEWIRGDAGDQITKVIRHSRDFPPLNNTVGAGVYDSESSIKTAG